MMFLGPCLSPFHPSAFNPVMSVCMLLAGQVGFVRAPIYMIGQLLGGICGVGLARSLAPEDVGAATTLCSQIRSDMTGAKAFSLQLVLSVVLYFSLTNVFMDRRITVSKWHQIYGAATFATTLAGAHWIGLTSNPMITYQTFLLLFVFISFLSFHFFFHFQFSIFCSSFSHCIFTFLFPFICRLAASVFESCWDDQWVYWGGSFVGAIIAAVLQRSFVVSNRFKDGHQTPSVYSRRTSASFE